ncbi:MAG: sigma-70 family RNA polymerase sigma factor [bacterium]|nr:sigma-70 family RNA polymerase sigma factor [bacterium]
MRATTMRMSDELDAELERAKCGDRDALDALLGRSRDVLERSARSIMGEELRARVRTSDILQATYLDVIASVGHFRGTDQEAFSRWVVRILMNNVRDAGKRLRAGKRSILREVSGRQMNDLSIPDPHASPSAVAALSEELLSVSAALQELPADYQRVILLHVVRGLSHEATARKMNRSIPASRVLLARARAALLLKLEHARAQRDRKRDT